MTVLEAMAAGLPVVAANVGGVPDLIEDAITGMLCEPLQPATIRAAIERLLNDTGLGLALAERAKESALRRFHPDVIARQHIQVYHDVLSTRS
jgi:glycosyltransferase involved in cell wall biosynthesis